MAIRKSYTWKKRYNSNYEKAKRRNWFNRHTRKAKELQVKMGVPGGTTW